MKANELIATFNFGISSQVIQEFYVNAIRKADFLMPPETAMKWIEFMEQFPCQVTTIAVIKTGIAISQTYRISYWDGAILAAATALEAPILYSEDLNHGQSYGSVRVVNPFIDIAASTGFHESAQARFAKD